MSLGDYVEILRRRRTVFLATFIFVITIGAVVAYILPPVYRSEATILIEAQEIPQDLVATTVTGYVQERIIGIKQSLVTYDNLVRVAEKLDLYPELRKSGDISEMVTKFRKSIDVEMIDVQASDSSSRGQRIATVSFTVGFESDDPYVAQKVAAELADSYLKENKEARVQQTAEVSAFIEEEAETLRKEIEVLEKKLATFKQEQREQLPELMDLNLSLYEKTEEKIEDTQERIQKIEDTIATLSAEISLTDPRKAVQTDQGRVIQSPTDRLSALTAEFLQASTRYTPTHPDIIRLRREIKTLGGQSSSAAEANRLVSKLTELRTSLLEARQKYSDSHPDVKRIEKSVSTFETRLRNLVITDSANAKFKNIPPDNPRYVALKTQIDTAYSNLSLEKAKLQNLSKKREEYENRLYQTPIVERDYQSLSRDYANSKSKYQELKTKLSQARLAEQLEAGEKAERFVLAGSAYLPTSPDKPNRLGILLLSSLLAFTAALGAVVIAEYRDNTVRARRGVAQIFGAMPIVVIPYIENDEDRQGKMKRRFWKIVVFLIFIICALVIVNNFFKPENESTSEQNIDENAGSERINE